MQGKLSRRSMIAVAVVVAGSLGLYLLLHRMPPMAAAPDSMVAGAPTAAAATAAGSPPPAAAAAGYTNNVFSDDFSSLDTIDMNNTQEPGFNWYPVFPFDPLSNFSRNLSIVTIGNTKALRLNGYESGIWGVVNGKHGPVGKSFGLYHGGGAYFEARIAMGFPGIEDSAKNYGWPSFWAQSTRHLQNLRASWAGHADANYEHFFEFDFMELMNPNGKNFNYTVTAHDWYGEANVTCGTKGEHEGTYCSDVQIYQNIGPNRPGTYDSSEAAPVFHTYGGLWVPSVKDAAGNYSTGYVQFYFDDGRVGKTISWQGAPPDYAYTPAGPWKYSILDQDPQTIVFDTGSGAFMYIDWVKVWQRP